MAYTNSSLVTYTKLSPNHSGQRKHAIDTITIHCMAGNLSVESCGSWFANPSAKASSNYGIDSTGKIALYVDEANRSWCSSNSVNDSRAITIEVANTLAQEPYPCSDAAYHSLILLVADVCRRNGIERLVWSDSRDDRVSHRDGCNMTVHRDFANKSCPGTWLYERQGQIAEEVNAVMGASSEPGIAIEPAFYEVTTQSDPLNVRHYPGSSGAVIGTFPKGEVVTATRKFDGWLYVTNGALTGWCNAAYLTLVAPEPVDSVEVNEMDIAKLIEDITPEQAACLVDKARQYYQKLPESTWATEELDDAVELGITDGSRPRDLATREEVAVMIARAGK